MNRKNTIVTLVICVLMLSLFIINARLLDETKSLKTKLKVCSMQIEKLQARKENLANISNLVNMMAVRFIEYDRAIQSINNAFNTPIKEYKYE